MWAIPRSSPAGALLGAVLHSVCLPALAQGECRFDPAGSGIVMVSGKVEQAERQVASLRDALRRKGVDPPAIGLEIVDESVREEIPALVAGLGLERRGANAIVTLSGFIARALARRSAGAPTVFATIVDPVAFGIVERMGPRRRNVTGITYDAGLEWKYVEHLKFAYPRVRRVGMLGDRPLFERRTTREVLSASQRRLGVRVVPFVAESLEELEAVFARPEASSVDGWIVPESPVVFRHESRVLELVGARKVPNIFGHPSLLEKGALMTFGVEFSGMYDELAAILRMICAGTPAREIPVVRARHVFLGVSVTNAAAYDLAVNPRILPLATTVH